MTRPTFLYIDQDALADNIALIRLMAPEKKIIAMVKANAYGCGLPMMVSLLAPIVDGFGVACLEEAALVRQWSTQIPCILCQGLFGPTELTAVMDMDLTVVIHNHQQLSWVTHIQQPKPLKIWVKIDTGMHRLGFAPEETADILARLSQTPWIDKDIVLMTHFACADTPEHPLSNQQIQIWRDLSKQYDKMSHSSANSAAILALPEGGSIIRPGIIVYGVSPFESRLGSDFGLKPVMHFVSELTTIHHYAAGESVGYGAMWSCQRPSVIGVVPVGYGDGYPRRIEANTPVWIQGHLAPIVGRVSMDMMTIDITDCPDVHLGDRVELWGEHLPVEQIAQQAKTIAYELMCRVSQRVLRKLRTY